jgi:hypothetical protein
MRDASSTSMLGPVREKKRRLKCTLALAVALGGVAALVMPAQAAAKYQLTYYSGTVGPSGRIGFDTINFIRKHHKNKKFEETLTFEGVPVTCDDGAHTTGGGLIQRYRVNNGQFDINVSGSGGGTLQVHGNVGRTAASGTISLSGTLMVAYGVTATNCASGIVNWTAAGRITPPQ